MVESLVDQKSDEVSPVGTPLALTGCARIAAESPIAMFSESGDIEISATPCAFGPVELPEQPSTIAATTTTARSIVRNTIAPRTPVPPPHRGGCHPPWGDAILWRSYWEKSLMRAT